MPKDYENSFVGLCSFNWYGLPLMWQISGLSPFLGTVFGAASPNIPGLFEKGAFYGGISPGLVLV